MLTRITWFMAGTAVGLGGSVWARRKVRRTAERLAPLHLATNAIDAMREAVREGRDAMRAKEVELRAVRDGHPATGSAPTPVRSLHVVVDATPELRAVAGQQGPRRRARR
ncbi:MAG: hypothetical protein ABJD24_04715 [Acidimicrobiales bacterium]